MTTDSTDQFQASLNEGSLTVPFGTWVISRTLSVPQGTRINLNGTIHLANASNCSMLHLTGPNILIEGNGILDGNLANQTKIVAGIDCVRVNRITLRGFTITNIHGWPVNFTSISYDIKLSEMELSNSLNAPEFADYCYDCWADKLHVFGISDYGFSFYGGVHRSGLTNSVIENCLPGAGVLADTAQPMKCQDIVIAHNIFYTNPGTTKGNVEAIYVVNNTGNPANNHSHVIVDHNIVYGGSTLSGGQKGATGTFVTLMSGVEDSDFTHNTIHDVSSSYGLEVSGERITVADNKFINVGVSQPRTSVGIFFNGAGGCMVHHNSITDTQPTKTLQYGISGTSGGNNTITHNRSTGSEKTINLPSGPGDMIDGNL